MPWEVAAIFQQNPSSGILMTAQPHIWDAKKRRWAPHMLCFVCLLTTYTCCKNVMVFYHILCCFWVLLLPWTIDRNPPRTQNFFVLCFAQNFWQIITYLHLHPLLVESWWSEWIVMAALLLLLFMMKVNVWHFNSHKVIRPHVVSLHSLSCYFQSV